MPCFGRVGIGSDGKDKSLEPKKKRVFVPCFETGRACFSPCFVAE